MRASNARNAVTHRFQKDDSEPLLIARHRENFGLPICRRFRSVSESLTDNRMVRWLHTDASESTLAI